MANFTNSILRYGGIDLPFLRTDRFVQEPVWSPDGTDLIATHFVIGVSGILNACFLEGNMDPACWIEYARPILLQRGNQLYFYIGGTQIMPPPGPTNPTTNVPSGKELVSAPKYVNPIGTDCYVGSGTTAINATLDAKLGPKPIRLDIVAIRGGTYAIRYEIECWVPYCAGGGPTGAILSNRWESSVDIDKDYFYTRTTNGTLILNGQWLDVNPAPTVLNQNALLILPPLFNGWKREVVRFNLSSDQLTLTYSIQDRQQYVSIPRPAVSIEATYAEISPAPQFNIGLAMMNVMQQNMDITVAGDPSTYFENSYPTGSPVNPDLLKYSLMQIMFTLVFSRIQNPFTIINEKGTNEAQMITHFELREDIMRPIVGCRVIATKSRDVSVNPLGSRATWESGVFSQTCVGLPLYLDDMLNQVATQPISIGNWATFLLLCSIVPQDPCKGGNIPAVYGQFSPYTTTVYSSQTTSAQVTTGTGYQQIVNLSYSCANSQYPFTEYTASVDFVTDNHILQLPIMYDVEQGSTAGTTQASSVFCQTASPTSRKIIHWKASRLGAWPKVPSPSSVDVYGGSLPSDKVLRHVISPGEVELSNDGITRHYAISGMMEIGMARRVQWDVASTVLSTITNPVIGSSVYGDVDASFPTKNFVSGILCSGTSPGAC